MGNPPTLTPPPDINSVAPTTKQRVLTGAAGLLGAGGSETAPLDAAIAKENSRRLDQAKMYRGLAGQLAGALATGFDPQTGKPLTPEQEQEMQHQYEAAWAAYEKAAGVSKDTKSALARGKAIVEHLIGAGRNNRQAQGGGGGGQPQGGEQPPAAQPGGQMQPPPKFDVNQAAMAAPVRQAQMEQGMALHQNEAVVNQRKQFAKDAGIPEGSLGYQEYTLTGKFPTQAHLQKSIFKDPKTGQIQEGSYDPSDGSYKDQNGKTVEGALPATASMLTPKQFKYMSPDGKLLPGFQVGMTYMDMDGNPLPSGTELYQRGLLPTETLRQVITYDGQGNPQINTLKTERTPKMPGSTGAGPASSTKPTGGGMSPPPKADGSSAAAPSGQARDATGKPLGASASMVNQQQKKVTAVREANTQLFGDPSNPTLTPLKDFSDLAEDPNARKRIGTALQFTFEELEGDAKAHGTLAALLSASSGIQPAIANAQARVRRNILDAMTPREREAYNATISAFSSIVALRSLTSASAAQFSVKALERDIPTIGLNTTTSKDFNEKLGRIGEIAYNGTKQINDQVMPKAERDYYKKQLEGLKSGAPRAGTHATTDEIMNAIKDVKKGAASAATKPAQSTTPN